jgi:endonuclease VIII
MPEGDTIHRTATRLRAALLGRPLTRVELPRAVGRLPLTGQTVRAVEARGKHLLIHVDDLVVHTHLGMTGSWRLYRPGERWRTSPRAARVVLGVDPDAVAVCFASPVAEVLDAAGPRTPPVAAPPRAGPVRPTADLDEARRAYGGLSTPRTDRGGAARPAVACGIGNVYRCDVLFLHCGSTAAAAGRAARCGTPIEVAGSGSRPAVVYWCPACQPATTR